MSKLKLLSLVMLFMASSLALSSCSNDEDEPKAPEQKTTYTITTDSNAGQIAQGSGLTSKLNYTILEYNETNEIVNTQDWYDIKDGISTKNFTASKLATKLVIKYDIYAYKDGKEVGHNSRYYAIVHYLNKNSNLKINIDGTSKVTQNNPL